MTTEEQQEIWNKMNKIVEKHERLWNEDITDLFPGCTLEQANEEWEKNSLKFLDFEGIHPAERAEEFEEEENMEWLDV